MKTLSPTNTVRKSNLFLSLCLLGSLALTACEIDLKEGKYEGTVSGSRTDTNGTIQLTNSGASMYIELTNDMPGNRADTYIFRLCEDLLPKQGVEGCEAGISVDVDDNVFSQYAEQSTWYEFTVEEDGETYYGDCLYTETINLVGEFNNDHQVSFTLEYSSHDYEGYSGCRDLAGIPHALDVEGIVTRQ